MQSDLSLPYCEHFCMIGPEHVPVVVNEEHFLASFVRYYCRVDKQTTLVDVVEADFELAICGIYVK